MSVDRRKFLKNFLVGAATIPTLTACGGSSDSNNTNGGGNTSPELPGGQDGTPTEKLQFLVVGDTGTGTQGQYHVAAAMEKVAKAQGAQFILGAGDNIYEEGVTSVDDPRFLDSFEYPYQNLDLPFYMCLGNHDCASTIFGGGSDNKRGDYQVDYHYSTNRYSNKWNMPARFYNEIFGNQTSGAPFLELFVVDSNPLTSFYIDRDENFNWQNYGYPQQMWMKETVESSQAHWKIAMSHVPYKSNGKHGNAGNLDEGTRILFNNPDADGLRYKTFLEDAFAHKVDMLFTGHDHSMQWIKPVPEFGPAHIIVSGAGGKTDTLKEPERNPTFYQREEMLGFVRIELTKSTMKVEFYVVDPDTGDYRVGFARETTKPVTTEVLAPEPELA
ncbi:metallophosphoesterase [uncultured Marinobacter sp.]|uniref:metallophosphoesterase n=1 Tax=uncultured Marinobacter sp. TaxID=187379 RepID=UPI0026300F8F|nr:metallophosphoesterase [uncultured Marinobacter sp.]